MRLSTSAALLLILSLSGTMTARAELRADKPWSEHLVYIGASDIRVFAGAKGELDYRVVASFPASRVDDWLSHELRETGWNSLSYDFFNPRSSPEIPWQPFWDATKDPKVCIHQEIRDWRNATGDFLRYLLRYKSPSCATTDLKDLEVTVVYYPANLARKVEEELKHENPGWTP